jgi:CRISPR-associated endonuclease/helicase Cas3
MFIEGTFERVPEMTDFAVIADRWPGKSAGIEGIAHPAVHHMLDVAVVAERLVQPLPFSKPLKAALVLLAALHDLGKVNAAFRSMLETGEPQRVGRHWEVSEALLRLHDATVLAPVLGARETRRHKLYAATAGHHGRPPDRELSFNHSGGGPGGEWKAMCDAAGPEAVGDAAAVIRIFRALWPEASLAGLEREEVEPLTWRLAGLVTAADWIGSNADWFEPIAAGPGPGEYLSLARGRAGAALVAAGLDTPDLSAAPIFDFALRPMQAVCACAPLQSGPMLAVIEDETGAGKTEAALILVQRMLAVRKGRGLYVALPTMATADAMFARIAPLLRRLYDGAPSLALAHGRAAQHEGFRALRDARAHNPDEPGPTEWLTDNRRRALLADVGIGTVDQALLAVVRAKHAALRLHGLSSKILIVDEVHEMGDPYMGELVASLLHAHAALGGSAILLTATLPLKLRAKLVAAFETGAGRPATPAPESPTYPALTLPGLAAPSVEVKPSARGPVAVARLGGLNAALDLLAEAAGQGAACVLIRNAVDEAIAAVEALREKGVTADLLHARFTLHDRKRHEAAVLGLFGKDRGPRPGRVLVATQVVESSLDLDFDVMVSDLAPMAALIQRAGRLWRHMDLRPAETRPVSGPVLHVLAPDPERVESAAWAQAVLGQGAYVYPSPLLWRTARELFTAGRIEAPAGLRELIEAAHDDGPVPPALEDAALRAEGRAGAERAHAAQNVIGWAQGYREGASGAGDADYPTRLGRPQRVLVLMREGAPWSGGAWGVDACQRSEVQAAEARLARLPLDTVDPPDGLPDWLCATRSFVAVAADGTICEGLRYVAESGLRFVSPTVRG